MPKRRKCPALPKEIWATIASYMPLKDWVKISCACKWLLEVHPAGEGKILIEGVKAIEWLKERTPNLTALNIQLDVAGEKFAEFEKFSSLPSSIPKAPYLQHLAVSSESLSRSERHKATQGWLKSVVWEHADTLQVLTMHVRALDQAQSMLQLKHLVLVTRDPVSADCVTSIAALPVLQILYLGSLAFRARHFAVDLRACRRLQRVCFGTYLPTAVAVNESCSIAINCWAGRVIRNNCPWLKEIAHAEVHLEEEEFYVDWDDIRPVFGAPHDFLFRFIKSLTLDAHGDAVGVLKDHLVVGADTFPELEILIIKCKTLFISFRPSVKLKSLSIRAEWALRIDVDDQKAMCSHLERIFCYGTWKDCDGAPMSIGRGLEHCERYPGVRCVMRRYFIIHNCGKQKKMAKVAFPPDLADGDGLECICQACSTCLAKASM